MKALGCWALYKHVVEDTSGNWKIWWLSSEVQPQSSFTCTRRCWDGCEIAQLGGWSKVDGAGMRYGQVKPWDIAMRTTGIVSGAGNKGDGRDALLAGQQPLLLNRLCKGYSFAMRCRYTADISNQLRLPIIPGSPTQLWVLRVTQRHSLANMRWTLTDPTV